MSMTVFAIKDVYGETIAEHVRVSLPGGKKRVYWRIPGMSPEDGLCGLSTPDLPLFGSELVGRWATGQTVVVTEGEPASLALRRLGLAALATVTGASSTPGEDALAVLLPFDVVLWPDFDPAGERHMDRVAATISRLGGSVRVIGRGRDRGDDAADLYRLLEVDVLIRQAQPWLPKVVAPEPIRAVRAYRVDDGDRIDRARSQIVDVVTARLGPPRRSMGRSLWWLCPFHGDRTPSFKVDMREPFFKCFGCGERGDVFDFLERAEGVGFKDALSDLAPAAGLGGIPRPWA